MPTLTDPAAGAELVDFADPDTCPVDPTDTDPAYLAFLAELVADDQRAAARRGTPAPRSWGDRLSATDYFCPTCWYAGLGDGSHSDTHPPCDPPGTVRGPYDPR